MNRHKIGFRALSCALVLWNVFAFHPGLASGFHTIHTAEPDSSYRSGGKETSPSSVPESLIEFGSEIAHLNATQFVGATIFADMERLARIETMP